MNEKMWTNKEIKRESKHNLKLNYWACIAVCFLLLIFAVEYTSSGTIFGEKSDLGIGPEKKIASELKSNSKGSDWANPLIESAAEKFENEQLQQATTGVMAGLANGITQTSHTLTFIADAVKKAVEQSPFASLLLALLGAALSLAFYMFFQAQLKVGERRFFLENRIYHNTKATRIFYLYTTTHVWNVAVIMFFRGLYSILWWLTIVGGVIKGYEYRAIPFILAENPGIDRKECFALAKEMTKGYKMKMFKFDVSYILWFVLGYLSMGLVSIFFINPYYRGGMTAVHARLREYAKAANTEHVHLLNDDALFEHPEEQREVDLYPTIKIKAKHELAVPWDRKYPIVHLGLMFFAFAMIGWCWEVIYQFTLDGVFVNRGSLWGPWLPIYGVGGVGVVILLKPLGKNPPLMAALTFVLCGVIEYVTAWYFETFKHIKYWDYTNYLFNIDGRVCLEGLIMFTVLASLGLYIIGPRVDDIFKKWPMGLKIPLLSVLSVCFIGDLLYTHNHPHTGEGITSEIDNPDNYS